jgi:hypothetical protein
MDSFRFAGVNDNLGHLKDKFTKITQTATASIRGGIELLYPKVQFQAYSESILNHGYGNAPIIFRYSSSVNALRVSVRIDPPEAIERATFETVSSSGASEITTMSY